MNIQNYHKLRFKYKLYFTIIAFLGICLSSYPTWEMSVFLAEYLNIEQGLPIKEQLNGLDWLIGFFVIGIVNFLFTCIFISYLIAKLKGWSYQQTVDYFLRYENFPRYWYKH